MNNLYTLHEFYGQEPDSKPTNDFYPSKEAAEIDAALRNEQRKKIAKDYKFSAHYHYEVREATQQEINSKGKSTQYCYDSHRKSWQFMRDNNHAHFLHTTIKNLSDKYLWKIHFTPSPVIELEKKPQRREDQGLEL